METALLLGGYFISLGLIGLAFYLRKRILKAVGIEATTNLFLNTPPWILAVAWVAGGAFYGLIVSSITTELYIWAHIPITMTRALLWLLLVAGLLFLIPPLSSGSFQSPDNAEEMSLHDYALASAGTLLGCIVFVLIYFYQITPHLP